MDADAYHCGLCKHGVVGDCQQCEDAFEESRSRQLETNIKTPNQQRNKTMKLSFNEKNVLRLMEATFSSSNTFITELMQNARRAGAEYINIICSDRPEGGVDISFTDDGIGIEDFAKLMTVAESGWSEEIQKVDKPFGAGFLAAILSCEHGHAISRGKKLSWVTKDLLAGESATVEDWDKTPKGLTEIYLVGVATKKPAMLTKIKVMEYLELHAYGFPVSINCNGQSVGREHLPELGIASIEIPDIGVLCYTGGEYSNSVALYLQGLPIEMDSSERTYTRRRRSLVLHLDSEKFEARMPDRAALRDDSLESIEKRIKPHLAALAEKVFAVVRGRLRTKPIFYFIARYAPELMKQAKSVPKALFERLDELEADDCYRALGDWQDGWSSCLAEDRITREGELRAEDFDQFILLRQLPNRWEDDQGAAAFALSSMVGVTGKVFVAPEDLETGEWEALMPDWMPTPWQVDFTSENALTFVTDSEPRAVRFGYKDVMAVHCPAGFEVKLNALSGEQICNARMNRFDVCTPDNRLLICDLENPGVELYRQDLEWVEGEDNDYRWDENYEDRARKVLAVELQNAFNDDEKAREAKTLEMLAGVVKEALHPYRSTLKAHRTITVVFSISTGGEVQALLNF